MHRVLILWELIPQFCPCHSEQAQVSNLISLTELGEREMRSNYCLGTWQQIQLLGSPVGNCIHSCVSGYLFYPTSFKARWKSRPSDSNSTMKQNYNYYDLNASIFTNCLLWTKPHTAEAHRRLARADCWKGVTVRTKQSAEISFPKEITSFDIQETSVHKKTPEIQF